MRKNKKSFWCERHTNGRYFVKGCFLEKLGQSPRSYLLSVYFFNKPAEAKCPRCCPNGEPVVTLTFESYRQQFCSEDTEDVFSFCAKPRCSSTRAHHFSKLVLVITGIPFLTKPLVSASISLRARNKPGKTKNENQEVQLAKAALQPFISPSFLPIVKCSERSSPLPPNVLAASPVCFNFSQQTFGKYSICRTWNFFLPLKSLGPVVLTAVVTTPDTLSALVIPPEIQVLGVRGFIIPLNSNSQSLLHYFL